MTVQVAVQTGSRLHLGPLAHRPAAGRHFGGVGLMIDRPGVQLSASAADRDEVSGPDAIKERVEKILARYRQQVSDDRQPPNCRVEIHQVIPAHQGLGSGTQLALAVGRALAELAGEAEGPVLELAWRVGRGKRSALGIHGFAQGGVLVDGGKRNPDEIGTLIWRREFPEAWRIVLITPPHAAGLSGPDELAAFHQLAGMPEAMTDRLCRLVLMDLLPAVVERDFRGVSEAIYEYGQQVGSYFEPIQGGRFASPLMETLAKSLRQRGRWGIGQSSWGPTIFVLEKSENSALELVGELRSDAKWAGCAFQIATPLNRGAVVETT